MKKYIVWILMIAMTLSLCACRPEVQTGGAGSSPEGGTGVSEEAGGLNEQVDDNAEDTETGALLGAQGEESADNTLIPEESKEGTEITENAPAENDEKAEVTLPATTTEDSALRAEADRIRKEQGELEYRKFCKEKDIKIYANINMNHDFEDNTVLVRLKKAYSTPYKEAPSFSVIDFEKVEEQTYMYPTNWTEEQLSDFSQSFNITLKTHSKQGVVDAIRELEKLDYVLLAEPNYLASHC